MQLGQRLVVVCSVSLTVVLALSGCMERRTGALHPRLGFAQEVRVGTSGFRNVDLLLVVDDSNSMREEQSNLAEQIPAMIRDLTSPPDLDGDGQPDWGSADRVRVAVVNTDLGTSGAVPPTGIGSACNGWGEDGAWRVSDECGANAALQEFTAGDDADVFATRIGCLVESLGVTGCGIEQQLHAAAKGVEIGAGLGFPADDAIFAVVMLTDEEDCSLADPSSFFGAFGSTNANVLCQRSMQGIDGRPEWLLDLPGLAARISGGREAEGFVFAAITGIPVDAAGQTPTQILARDDMQYREQGDPSRPEPVPSCEGFRSDGTSLGRASPPRRIVGVAGQLPGSVLHSICTDDFRPAVQDIVARIAERLPSVCLTRAIPIIGDRVDCRVEELLPAGMVCDEVPGRTGIESRDGREVCLVDQVPGGVGSGFFYDLSDAACAKLSFTEDAIPPLGSSLTVDCYFEVPQEPTGPLGP